MRLFNEIELGGITLKNRMVMAAMTRSRASFDGVVQDITVEYYKQRASAGLILTEAINISEDALGSPLTPGIYTQEQIDAWKKVTEAVHAQGGKIVAQLWHTGRVGHSVDRNGKLPLAPSAIAIPDAQHFTGQGMKPYEAPQALTIDEIQQTIQDYRSAAKNALEAGFDGVELHAANGYLPNQFLAESANQRTDEYGGSVENRSRFVLEVMDALIDEVGGEKVGIKISPLNPYAGIVVNDPIAIYSYLIDQLNQRDFAFVEIQKRSAMFPLLPGYPTEDEIELFGSLIDKPLIANTGYGKETAEQELEKGIAELISFGALFLANPDLPKRFEKNAKLNVPDRNTFFGGGIAGYIDYPFLEN